ncbi:hypothetical protein FRC06_001049 [Ceratobasidium sp. 370]|nr:hypothetical protein FRC06_001049 [Ceratobasidium sp. 370]
MSNKTQASPLIAIDMDDVLCRTNEAAAAWHNAKYNTSISISDFHYYHYWKNPGWGTPTETLRKVKLFSGSDELTNVPPVDGAIEGIKSLKALGYRLEIVTARGTQHRSMTDNWLSKWLPGVVDKVHYTGEFEHNPNPPPVTDSTANTKRVTKADILVMIGARALVDDSLPNALLCASVVPVLLFGDYQWNQRPSADSSMQDRMSYAERERWEETEAKHRAAQTGTKLSEADWHKWWERENLHELPPNVTRFLGKSKRPARTLPKPSPLEMPIVNLGPHVLSSGVALLAGISIIIGARLISTPKRTQVIRTTDERVLIIGASSGVGRATAVAYAKRGARVTIVARRAALLQELEQECIQAWEASADKAGRVLPIVADFGNEDDMARVRDTIRQAWNGLDTVVIAAGVSALQPVMNIVKQGGVGHIKAVAFKALEGNYIGPLVSAATLIPLLETTSEKPAIALISSLAAVVPAPTRALYCSTKSASLVLFQSLAIEHPRIKFTNIIPSTIEGDFRASAVDGGDTREVLKGALGKQVVAEAIR